ncbi:hypothetical protein FOZ63_016738 [Perkinsus olseni]|uniref:Uncharacterized protein n=1 Tax=Perkinsus olseni TaxID=32597 RepID=A0A7J6RCW8_PEROL|nr:hypothetical protein FOZ62_016422 [Perkinsus olseni]KAF4733042.1 hypothetical protein FOZ63_016738 [Perkinsus olseni]
MFTRTVISSLLTFCTVGATVLGMPGSPKDIPWLYAVSGNHLFYVTPNTQTCSVQESVSKTETIGSCEVVTVHNTAACPSESPMDVTVYVVDHKTWKTKRYGSIIYEYSKQFSTLEPEEDSRENTDDLTAKLNAFQRLTQLDSSETNFMWALGTYYGGSAELDLALDFGEPGFLKGYCDVSAKGKRRGGKKKVTVAPIGRSALTKVELDGSEYTLILEGSSKEELEEVVDDLKLTHFVQRGTKDVRKSELGKWYRTTGTESSLVRLSELLRYEGYVVIPMHVVVRCVYVCPLFRHCVQVSSCPGSRSMLGPRFYYTLRQVNSCVAV